MKKMKIHLSMSRGSGAYLRYTGDDGFKTEEERLGKRHAQKKRGDRKSHGGSIGRRSEAIVAKRRAPDEYTDKTRTQTRTASSKTRLAHYRSARTRWVVVLITIWTMTSVSGEGAEAGSG